MSARPSEVSGLYAIPIFDDVAEWAKASPTDRGRPFAALIIDNEGDFAPIAIDATEQDALANVAALVGEEIRDRTIVRAEHAGTAPSRSGGWDVSLSTDGSRVAVRKVRDPGDGDLGGRVSSALLRLKSTLPVGAPAV